MQEAIFRVVAAILHLGNINFDKGKETDSSKLKDEKSVYHLETAAELLMCDTRILCIKIFLNGFMSLLLHVLKMIVLSGVMVNHLRILFVSV